jgi:hypothetical protein
LQKLLKIIFVIFFVFSFFVLFVSQTVADQEIKPVLTWGRSKEDPGSIRSSSTRGGAVSEGLELAIDPSQTVWDNGVATDWVNKSKVPAGTKWASWRGHLPCSLRYDVRHFRATFKLNTDPSRIKNFILYSPYYTQYGNLVPINDNIYLYINGNFAGKIGTSYGGWNLGFVGTAPYANETDGWLANGDFGSGPAGFLRKGTNQMDIVAEEYCYWGGMGYLELKLVVGGLAVPYFNQTDPPWGSQEYDHANSIGPFWCGQTIAQCGCALTSSAMLLKYYGVGQSPNYLPTTPETLNNWLKGRQFEYLNGDVNWIEVAKYSLEANRVFGTPKIDYAGVNSENFSLLNNDLDSNKPVILQVSSSRGMHFVVATGIFGSTYTINDPISISNTNLQSYNNHFSKMRRYSLTNTNLSAILLTIPSPGEILLIDSQGRKLGKDPTTGEVFNQIPNGSFYLQEALSEDTSDNPIIPAEGSGNYYIEILDPSVDEYTVHVEGENLNAILLGYDQDANVSGGTFGIQGQEEFKLNYSPQLGSKMEVTQIISIDIKPGSDPNSINLKSNGVIPVAILTTRGFDATQVDVSTVRFGPNQTTETHGKGHWENVDNDEDTDLLLHFRTKETGIQNSDAQACLIGMTLSGTSIQGCDSIRIVK